MKWIVCWTLGLVSRQTPDWICACQKGFLRSSTWDSPLPFWLYCTASFYICQVFLCDHPKIFGCAAPSMYRRTAPPGPSAPEKQQQDQPVDDGGTDAENQHRPRHREQLGPGAGDHTLWLCQDRHTVFSEFFQLPPKWGALIVLACRYKFKPARSTHIYLNLS